MFRFPSVRSVYPALGRAVAVTAGSFGYDSRKARIATFRMMTCGGGTFGVKCRARSCWL